MPVSFKVQTHVHFEIHWEPGDQPTRAGELRGFFSAAFTTTRHWCSSDTYLRHEAAVAGIESLLFVLFELCICVPKESPSGFHEIHHSDFGFKMLGFAGGLERAAAAAQTDDVLHFTEQYVFRLFRFGVLGDIPADSVFTFQTPSHSQCLPPTKDSSPKTMAARCGRPRGRP